MHGSSTATPEVGGADWKTLQKSFCILIPRANLNARVAPERVNVALFPAKEAGKHALA